MPNQIRSGIEGLDTILAGGFIPGGITIVQGRPGTGKAIMEYRKFIYGLQIQAAVPNCTMSLMSHAGEGESEVTAEHTMVDRVIDLRSRLLDWRPERDIEALKRHGADLLLGRHAPDITGAGISASPRFEACQVRPCRDVRPDGARVPSGLPPRDDMFGGGLPQHSTTVLEGPPGIGKTTAGPHFLSPCSAAEPGLLFTTTDSPEALLAKARTLDLPVAGLIDAGHVEIAWQSSTDGLLDAALHRLMRAVRRTGARRLCIDYGVLPTSGVMHTHLSAIADNVLVLRTARRRSSLIRLMSVFKARDAQIDPRARSYQIGHGGIAIDDPLDGPEAPPSGRPPSPARPET